MPADRRFQASSIKNKMKREDVHRKMKRQKGQEKLKRRLELVEAERKDPELRKARLEKNTPRTLDNMREYDPSMLTRKPAPAPAPSSSENEAGPSSPKPATSNEPESANNEEIDDENAHDISTDPFASYFSLSSPSLSIDPETGLPLPPKVLITTSSRATKVTFDFCAELKDVIPGGEFIRRKKNKGFEIGRVAGWAAGRGYGAVVVVNEDRKKCNAITMIHLPSGPTAYFKLTSVQLSAEIHGHARPSPHHPELILNGFVTRLGHMVGRMFQTLYPPVPEFEGRQVVTLHNQRDFLFFRRHRYMFKSPERAALQEIGPRFTLKLKWIKKGIPAVKQLGATPKGLEFDDEDRDEEEGEGEQKADGKEKERPGQDEEYVWQWKSELETSRKTFFL
ncbi:Brix-domain-containing protein [Clavulina sp. PMI_390]|nr:Brix-domain-containing protein [Clavulina sp. PMI_390]